ncbi:MAG: MCE family protein [Prevotella sp.]|jgi:phospholipid/cholesterol/gamma-HCH transport system substrate-binding protein|nr:MCE family protein [Prevotella sp.]
MKITKEIKIALVAIVSIVLLFFGMNFLKGMTLFSNGDSYYITFKDISGLSSSSPIFANGYRVGVVKDVSFDYENNGDVVVEFMVDDDLQIPRGSTAEIVSDLMGNVKMNLLLADNPRDFVAKGDTIMGVINSGMLGKAKDMIPVIEKMLPKLDSILANINMLLSDPNIGRTLGNVQKTTENLTVTTQQLNALMANVNKDVPGLMGKASGLLDNANNLTANLAAVDVASTVAKVDQTLANVQQLTSKLNDNKGTLGLLMNDETLYYNLTNTVLSADSLLNNLREHPKRYVHFSLFGKKDK